MTVNPYESCDQLLDATELVDVRFYEVHGERNDSEGDPKWFIRVLTNQADSQLQLRFRLQLSGSGATYTADAAAVYVLKEPVAEVPDDVVREFAERVGIFAAFPYLRAAIGNLASQLGLERPVLPMLRQGMVRLSPDDPE
ncbi:hypothetical protein PBI_BLUEBERRY_40 [Gordonia phage Blueberry]|uniref:Preprotein translocase subunit SecB n=1 Tax=Gordonia phage Azula TaxID=2762397 RepID=A0A7G8LKT0_9CAUD|nr:hypothetical protein BH771_gp40 [Gordonia phage Blueberry]YP_010109967.1 hypothetical protein KNV23_gp41 [Gordonia phage Azula]QGJ97415.1 hypothetical protein SEA_GAMBINO_43 [Gordonia phage Gambino]QZD97473.1 hypothetical protein SEA_MISSRONA_41 [Gordonia phage MissRona]ANA85502.1 hypothetical protein PBI_BLUEBERRY_40 [Gordonia phage Blueberry]QNJ57852.1 hypothetical protein SEA_AZULA_41 [Gordonia phage Azula]